MPLLTEAEKAAIFNDFNVAISTYERPLTVYQEAQKTVIVANPDYNPYTSYNQNSADIQNTPVSTTIVGRIMWDKKLDWQFLKPGGLSDGQYKVKQDMTDQAVRLKVGYSGYALLKDAKRVQIDSVLLEQASLPRQHGPFGTGYWTFFYTRTA